MLDLQRSSLDPEQLHAAQEHLKRMQHCLEQLDKLNSEILRCFHGMSASPTPTHPLDRQEGLPTEATHPLTDAQIAEALSGPASPPWTPARVKMRRHRAYALLHRCMQGEATAPLDTVPPPIPSSPVLGQAGDNAMSSERTPASHPSHAQLLAWLETPADLTLSHIAQHLESCPTCQVQLEAGVELLNALNAPYAAKSFETLQTQEPAPLPEPVRAKLLAIGVDAPVLTLPPPTRKRSIPAWAWPSLALAACVLLVLALRRGSEPDSGGRLPITPPGQEVSEAHTGYRGAPDRIPPMQVWVRAAGAQTAQALPLTWRPEPSSTADAPLAGWEGRVSRAATLQLGIRAPETSPASGRWEASVTCLHAERGPIPLAPQEFRWTGQAASTTPELLVGRPLNLLALDLPAGDQLRCTVVREAESMILTLVLLP